MGLLLLDHVLQRIKADTALVLILSKEHKLEELASMGCMAQASRTQTMAAARLLAASVINSGRAEILNDASSDPRLANCSSTPASLMSAPLKVKDNVIGVMQVATNEPHSYTADDLRLLSSMTIQAATVIENARLYDTLQETFFSTVNVLAETIEMRDHYTGGHTRRVGQYAVTVARSMGLQEEELDTLRLAASLHDIGKIGIDDQILRKPGRLTPEEYESIKRHSEYGAEILSHVRELHHIVPIVRSHHEQYNGNGYPDGLAGEDIPLLARIISVVDAFDAMSSHRPYRQALPLDAAVAELVRNRGTQFDPQIVDAFLGALRKGLISV